MTNVLVDRVVFEGRRAVGVDVLVKGQVQRLSANAEVIVSAGAVNSPQILLRSGIGPGAELQRHGVEVIHELV